MKILHAVLSLSGLARCINGLRLDEKSSLDLGDHNQDYSAIPTYENGEKRNDYVDEACTEFDEETPLSSGWLLQDCVTVWSRWANTLDDYQFQPYFYRDVFNETAKELRQQGNPCVVDSFRYPDGVGSSAVRLLATWMFAEEMNCDWITPESPRSSIDDNGTSLYCHPMMVSTGRHEPDSLDQAYDPKNGGWRCEVTNWLQFFHYDAHGVHWLTNGTVRTLHPASRHDRQALTKVVEEYGKDHPGWNHLLFYMDKVSANRIFHLVSSWDSYKREVTRGVLQRFRESFYEFPRPWASHCRISWPHVPLGVRYNMLDRFDRRPQCMFSSSSKELNFVIHVRLGDRVQKLKRSMEDYIGYLETFMDRVTTAVTQRGLDPPTFHVFSETFEPCPSEENGTFSEFPTWPVETYQIAPCLTPLIPEDCPEKRAGAPACNPERSGIFRVSGKSLYLHVGLDVQNDISCMIEADGVLMGCSTFGQIAGVLSKGLKFFSFECTGWKTPNHYKMMPPLAIAEKGKMWVPVSGAWNDPVIMSQVIFEVALEDYIKDIGLSESSS